MNQLDIKPKVGADSKRIDVSVEGDQAFIRLLSYSEGIGWYVQKTIQVEPELLDDLTDQLSVARGRIRREGDEILCADILDF